MREGMRKWLKDGYKLFQGWWYGIPAVLPIPQPEELPVPLESDLTRLNLVVLTEGVAKTLFQEYHTHRQSSRGSEEFGWLLMGLRLADSIIVSATIPAGASRDAGVAHIRFNAQLQSLWGRLIRQQDRRLGIVGIVHTHPGSLRHPSGGDYQGDSEWILGLRGKEGVFGIGTFNHQQSTNPPDHILVDKNLQFNWYSLAEEDERYCDLRISILPGEDRGVVYRPLMPLLERNAAAINRLAETLKQIKFNPDTARQSLMMDCATPYSKDIRIELLSDGNATFSVGKERNWRIINPISNELESAVFEILQQQAKPEQLPAKY